ncbi:protein mono-ADP-ribosyltransferase PARP12-like [Pelobates fuscus]|uniref:protein mono-ADP-ribosyltransferase PARP12-like n=1 Tax=Pelobates fuscus TaxID=191477 RepID=UPI002FE4CFDA
MSAYEGLSSRLRTALCVSGGSMDLDVLGRTLGLTSEQLTRLVEEEEGRSIRIREQEGKRVAVYKSELRVCSERTRKCAGDCGKLHLCRYFIMGSCTRSPCKFNHSVQTPHNFQVLRQHQLEALGTKVLQQLLLQNDPSLLPDICMHYNRGDGPHGSCTFKDNCNKLHICQHYLQGDCMFGSKCKRSHDFKEEETLKKLTKWGLSGTFLPELLSIYINASAMTKSSAASPVKEKAPPKNEKPKLKKSTTIEHIDEICLYFITKTCSFKDRCVRNHYHLPYRWQVFTNDSWKDFDTMEDIEKAYCDPNSRVPLAHLDFSTMTYNSYKIRRLSTPSAVSKPPHFILTTEWLWYWKDEYKIWNEYGAQCDLHKLSTISSSDLENVYMSDTTARVPFKAGKHEYVLSFKDMIQRNTHYGTERMVCRRPTFVSVEDVKKKKVRKSESLKEGQKSTPPQWDTGDIPDAGYKLVPLGKSSEEYNKIDTAFRRTLPSMNINSIHRIQNLSLWEVYQWQKEQMKKHNGGNEVEEKQLFHGTNDKLVDAICQQNFDWRICGAHGTAYGKGSYFARDSSYSHNYSQRTDSPLRVMFVARVLVGDYTPGKSSYLRPPSKNNLLSSSFFDSCVDNARNPSIFVIFEKHQIYPEYLIKYSDEPRNLNSLLSALKKHRI